jgi:RNA polymerase sigma factor (sigma-70 family)
MIPSKINPGTIATSKGVESIIEWFEQRKRSYYMLGQVYLKNQLQLEELFYQSIIIVHKEFSRLKSKLSFEVWVTSIFIHACREIANESSDHALEEMETRQDFFKALDQLKADEKEAMALNYVKGLSQGESAQLLQVSTEKLKELLFSGIQSLRKEMGYGSNFHGCKEYHGNYIDYIERTMDRSKKIDFEIHIYQCPTCQEDLATFQEVMLNIKNLAERMEGFHVPSDFMENVKARLAEREKLRQQKNKKRIRVGIVFASIFALLVGMEVFTRAFSKLYYTWTEDNQELRAFLQQDLGESLNLEAESEGVKIKIKSVIADDIQTLVFYEIEDTKEDNQYELDFNEGFSVENDYEVLSREAYPTYYPPDLKSDVNRKEKNVYHGKLSLPPLRMEDGTIQLKITKLQKLNSNSSDRTGFGAYEIMGYETGEWDFDIPVTKQASVDYALDKETKIEGITVHFEKLTFAPTATILKFAINNNVGSEKQIQELNFDTLEVNGKKVKADLYGNVYSYQAGDLIGFQSHFDSLFGEKPKEIKVQFSFVRFTFENHKSIELDTSKEYPQTFEYAGSTISIDKVEVGQPTKVVLSNHDIERAYESLNFNIVGEDESEISSMEMDSEGVIVDKNGKKYDMNNIPVAFEEIEQPRHIFTVQSMALHPNNPDEKVIPKKLEIYGYTAMKYLDNVVKISLE